MRSCGRPSRSCLKTLRGKSAVSCFSARLLHWVIRAYQLTLSPVLGPACRFYPSCSEYALQAISRHGPARGVLLGLKRVLRCHPFHAGGIDPVP
ncbi:MAG: membrane protein insertion efficiency factor YidD [Desulfobacteraceae bacterium]|nr:MAG: membrane protein insertion efficiency factor YidD [Desulfobacteraceae bacterium]